MQNNHRSELVKAVADYALLAPGWIRGLLYAAKDLPDKEQEVIRMLYREYKTLEETGKLLGMTSERVRQIRNLALSHIRNSEKRLAMVYGLDEYLDRYGRKFPPYDPEDPDTFSVGKIGLSTRAYNALFRNGYMVVGDVAKATPEELASMRNVGQKTVQEIIDKMHELGHPDFAPE